MTHHSRPVSTLVPGALALLVLLAPELARAHVGLGHAAGFAGGLAHPLAGLDHLAAMLAVGVWAAQQGGRARWIVPLAFAIVMVLGGALGAEGLSVPLREQGIVVSVLGLGVLIAAAIRLPLRASASLVGLFALFHGDAHGAEMAAGASGLAYGAGFALATAGLHGLGLGIAALAAGLGRHSLVRASGAAIALCGAYLWVAA